MLINQSRVKEAAGQFRVSTDFYAALDARVREQIERATTRARANGRTTLMPHDL